jgi:triphosphatase
LHYVLPRETKQSPRSRATSMPAGPEVELKFLFAEKDLAKINAFISAVADERKESRQRLRTTYFDTPKLDLWHQGFTLRVRATGSKYIQTIKRIGPSSVQRDEWEEEIGRPEPGFKQIKASPLGPLARRSSIRRALRPAFGMDVERTSLSFESGGGLIEASLDRGSIEAHGETLGVRELELELKRGEISALFDLARALVSQAPVHPCLISKAERGHLLAQGSWGRAAKSSEASLDKGTTCELAFKEICRACLHDFDLNVPALQTFDHVEGVHQARVAIRRLRAAITFFKPVVFDTAYRRLRDELKWLARLLGTVRDLDVLQANLSVHIPEDEAKKHLNESADHCEAKRFRAHQAVIQGIESERGRRLLLDLMEWVETGQWQSEPSPVTEEPIQKFARRQLKERWRKLVKGGADLAKLGSAARHRIRIEAKKLRYMAQFFVGAPSFANDQEDLKALTNQCEKLQDALGTIRDEEAMADFMQNEARTGPKAVKAGAKTAILSHGERERLKSSIAKELKTAARSYSRLASLKPF